MKETFIELKEKRKTYTQTVRKVDRQIERNINRQKDRKAITIMCMKVVDERDIY
jgi:hypothetical protein